MQNQQRHTLGLAKTDTCRTPLAAVLAAAAAAETPLAAAETPLAAAETPLAAVVAAAEAVVATQAKGNNDLV